VIEFGICPVIWIVAIAAVAAENSFVSIVVEVAIDALAGRVAVLVVGLVAVGTFRLKVLTKQLEVGDEMIKCRFIKTHDIGIAPFMIGMACGTWVIPNIIGFAMNAGSAGRISCNIFVAVEAKLILLRTVERSVA